MASKPTVVVGDARAYTADDWLKYGDVPNPSTKEKMIMLAIEQIIRVGPADFSAVHVCDRLDIKHPMINHYFGNRHVFMAEVNWWAFREWSKGVDRIFRTAPKNPKKRLRAFIEGEVEFAKRMGGMHLLINYPMVSATTMQILSDEHQAEMQKLFEYHLALITVCVRDIRKRTVSEFDFDADTIPKVKLLTPPKDFLTATQISWATHGLASWSSGRHVATQGLEDLSLTSLTTDYAVKQMVQTIVEMAEAK